MHGSAETTIRAGEVPDRDHVDVLLVCSTGGHLLQLLELRRVWSPYRRAWVTHDRSDAQSLLRDEQRYYGHMPTTRNVKNLVRNVFFAWRVLRRKRPQLVLTTGAAIGVPFVWLARLLSIPVVYIESFARVESPSLTCRLVRRAAGRVYVQWPELVPLVPGARYAGSVFSP